MQPSTPIRVPLSVAIVLSAVLCLVLASAAQAAVAWQPPAKLAETLARTPRVAVDAAGDATAVWIQVEGNEKTIMSSYRQAGGSWTAPVALSATLDVDSQFSFGPNLAVDPAGDTVVIWDLTTKSSGKGGTGAASVVQAAHRPAGGDWGTPQTLSAPSTQAAAVNVAIADSGEAIAAWTLTRESGMQQLEAVVQGATMSTAGVWSGPTDVSTSTENPGAVAVATDATGDATLVWTISTPSGSGTGISAAERPAGGGFESPFALASTAVEPILPKVAYDGRGDAVAAWLEEEPVGGDRLIESSSRSAGGSWGQPELVTPIGTRADGPHIGIDEAGVATAVWLNSAGGVASVESADRPAGGVWGPAVRLSAAGLRAYDPQLGVDAAGDSIAAWEGLGPGFEGVQAAIRPTGGTWGAPVDLSETGVRAGAVDVAIVDAGHAFAVWRTTNQVGGTVEASAYEASESSPEPGPPTSPETAPPSDVVGTPAPSSTPQVASPSPGGIGLLKVGRVVARGVGALTLSVPGAGTVTIGGVGVKALTLHAAGAGPVVVRLLPRGAYRRRLATHRRAFTTIHVAFVGDDGTRLEFDRRVRLVLRTSAAKTR